MPTTIDRLEKQREDSSPLSGALSRGLYVCVLCTFLAVGNALCQTASGAVEPAPDQRAIVGVASNLQNIPIAPGDLLHVDVFDTPDLSGDFRVDQHGNINFRLEQVVKVGGLTLEQAGKAVEDRLIVSNIMTHPNVTVSVLQYAAAGITVLGEVRRPGIFTLLGPHSLYDALAAAGGPTDVEGSTIQISHADDAYHPTVVEVKSPNYSAAIKATTVVPGDTVVVSKADLVFAVGDILHPGSFPIPYGHPLTILNLLALTQGFNRTAAVSRASIVRSLADGSVISIDLDLNKVMKSEQQNIALQAGDVLVVPRSGFKSFTQFALPGFTNAVGNTVLEKLVLQ